MSSAGTNPGSDQWLRKISLIVSSADGNGLDLSQMHIKFSVQQSDVESPNNALIQIFNLSDTTTQQIEKEFTRVTLQAGYQQGAFGIIFDGTIKQVRRGRLDNMNTFIYIYAADADIGLNFGVVARALSAGATPQQQAQSYADAMNLPLDYQQYGVGDVSLIRGKVQYGMSRDGLRNLTRSTNTSWTVQNGKIVIIPLTGYLPGEAVVINFKSGMIGLPTQTEEGIEVTTLLNPNFKIGTQVHIDNSSIQQPLLDSSLLYLDTKALTEYQKAILPKLANDGFYRVLVCEFEGDTRGQPWYAHLICLTVNKTVPADQSVKKYG